MVDLVVVKRSGAAAKPRVRAKLAPTIPKPGDFGWIPKRRCLYVLEDRTPGLSKSSFIEELTFANFNIDAWLRLIRMDPPNLLLLSMTTWH